MLTIASISVPEKSDEYEIFVDVDDSGWAYIKQCDDWVCFPVKLTDKLIAALNDIRRE